MEGRLKRPYAVFGHVARLPESTLASQTLSLKLDSHVTNRFLAVPTGNAVLIVRVVGGWISCVRTTIPQLTYGKRSTVRRAGHSGATLRSRSPRWLYALTATTQLKRLTSCCWLIIECTVRFCNLIGLVDYSIRQGEWRCQWKLSASALIAVSNSLSLFRSSLGSARQLIPTHAKDRTAPHRITVDTFTMVSTTIRLRFAFDKIGAAKISSIRFVW